MKSSFFKAFLLGLLTLGMSACTKENTENNPNMVFSLLSARKVYSLENSAKEYNRESDVTYCDSASLILPVKLFDCDINTLHDTIIKIAFDTCAPHPEVAVAAYFEKIVGELGYNAIEIPDSVLVDEIDGFTTIRGDIFNMTESRLTYRILNETYIPGAAHGMTNSRYLTYDLQNGQIISLEDLFTPEGLEMLPKKISERAKKFQAQLGPTNIESLPSEDDFYISLDDEIVFVYQPYEVASYSQGMICVPFYPYQLADFMTPEGLKFFMLSD